MWLIGPTKREKWEKIGYLERELISIVGRTILINSSLSSSFIYHMSLYLLPKTMVDDLVK